MKWEKKGMLYNVDNKTDWMVSHVANPTPEHLYDDVFRIYFSCRDKNNRSSISFIDYDIVKQLVVDEPMVQVLAPGAPGLFDDAGCSVNSIINTNEGRKYLYYLGWYLGVSVPFSNYIGLAVWSEETKKFIKYRTTPIMDRTEVDPYSTSYNSILHINGIYKMWYGSSLTWGNGKKSDMIHVIKYAESQNGINWNTQGHVCISGKTEEYAFARPCVIYENDIYKMWYSYRGSAYRIGYAESSDGLNWTRMDDKVGIDVSEYGWDSEMIEYPYVFDHKDVRYMLYSGNSFGKTGFGLAVLIR